MRQLTDWKSGKLYVTLRAAYHQLLKIRGEPNEIALGFALGVFIGASPTIGFQMIIAVPIAAILKWNKVAAAAGVWISNPITAPFLYGMTYYIGAKILNISGKENVALMVSLLSEVPSIMWNSIIGEAETDVCLFAALKKILSTTSLFLWAATIGGFIVGTPMAVAAYYFVYSAVNKYQAQIKHKLIEQKAKLAIKKEAKIRKIEEQIRAKRKRKKRKKKRL